MRLQIFFFTLIFVILSVLTQNECSKPCIPCPNFNGVEFSDLEGFCNNKKHANWGSIGHTLLRTNIDGNPPYKGGIAEYGDGIGEMIKRERNSFLSARDISNNVFCQCDIKDICNEEPVTDFFTFFGQFMNHDMNSSPNRKGINNPDPIPEKALISIPQNDPFFKNYVSSISFSRSDVLIGSGITSQREQLDDLTAYLDLSDVYSVNRSCNAELREYRGGRMLMQDNYLPTVDFVGKFQANRLGQDFETYQAKSIATIGMFSPHPFSKNTSQMFAGGDKRAAENFGLLTFQTLFLRNHNFHADRLQSLNPNFSDDHLFYLARQFNIAEYQKIVFSEFLPALLGEMNLPPYKRYDDSIDPSINQEYVTGVLRMGHSTLSPLLFRRNSDRSETGGDIFLRDMFFQYERYKEFGGLDSILFGMIFKRAQKVDLHVVDGVRNFLFGPGDPSLGLDLISLNIQRGRDHGILSFNNVRRAYNLPPYTSFFDITRSQEIADLLGMVYNSVEDCDLFVCGLAEEPHVKNGIIGETFATVLKNQFERIRDGDRFFYLNQCGLIFSQSDCDLFDQFTMLKLIQRHVNPNFDQNPFHFIDI